MLVKKSMAANASTGIVNCRLGVCQDLLLVNVFIEAIFLTSIPLDLFQDSYHLALNNLPYLVKQSTMSFGISCINAVSASAFSIQPGIHIFRAVRLSIFDQ